MLCWWHRHLFDHGAGLHPCLPYCDIDFTKWPCARPGTAREGLIGLKHAVITSVNRDDLPDGVPPSCGLIEQVKQRSPLTTSNC